MAGGRGRRCKDGISVTSGRKSAGSRRDLAGSGLASKGLLGTVDWQLRCCDIPPPTPPPPAPLTRTQLAAFLSREQRPICWSHLGSVVKRIKERLTCLFPAVEKILVYAGVSSVVYKMSPLPPQEARPVSGRRHTCIRWNMNVRRHTGNIFSLPCLRRC